MTRSLGDLEGYLLIAKLIETKDTNMVAKVAMGWRIKQKRNKRKEETDIDITALPTNLARNLTA